MNSMRYFVLATCIAAVPLSAQVEDYETQEAQSVVPLKGATEASVLFDMNNGDLVVSSGTEYLMRGVFNFSATGRKPDVSYRQDNGNINLYVSSRADEGDWRIFLTRQLPIELGVNGSEGLTRLALGDLKIRSINIDKDGGATEVQLDGAHPELERIKIGQGPGPISLWMPGSYANLQQIVHWSNDSTNQLSLGGKFPALKEIEVEILGGRGDINLSGSYAVLEDVRVYGGPGDVKAKLTGEFEVDLLVELLLKKGSMDLELPSNIGVIASVKTTGEIQSDLTEQETEKPQPRLGWLKGIWDKRQGERIFVNDAYGKSERTMRVEITSQDATVMLKEAKS